MLYPTNLIVFVDITSAPTPTVFLPPPFPGWQLHFPQVDSPPPGGNVTHSHSQSPGQQRGVWRGQAAGTGLIGAKVRENNGSEVPAGGTRGGAVVWSVSQICESICHPPTPAPAFICGAWCRALHLWGLCEVWLFRFFIFFSIIAILILLHSLSAGFLLGSSMTTNTTESVELSSGVKDLCH